MGERTSHNIVPSGQAPNFLVEQGSLDDCTSILRYQDLTYTVRTYEYNVSPDGKIKERTTGTAQKPLKIRRTTAPLSGLKNLCPILRNGIILT